MSIAEMLILSAALSIDAVGIGASCRIKGISMPFRSKLEITFVSFVLTEAAVLVGGVIGNAVSSFYAKIAGAVLLLFLGAYIIVSEGAENDNDAFMNISDRIGVKEAVCIGTAVSGDSVAVGIGIGNQAVWFPLICALFQFLCLCIGDGIAVFAKEKFRIRDIYLTLASGLVIPCIDEKWRLPPAFRDKIAEAQHAAVDHKMNKLFFVSLHDIPPDVTLVNLRRSKEIPSVSACLHSAPRG